jgi:penicillin-binding protein 1A
MNFVLRFFLLSFVLVAALCVGMFFFASHHNIVDFSALEQYTPGKPSLVLDDEGNELARFQLDRREQIKLSQMPHHLIQAFVSAEDRTFFNHAGISWKGIVRSLCVNMMRRRKAQGASTITQQLTRLLFFDGNKTFTRKIKEQLVALIIEQQFTKEQILEAYLNHIYFGCGIYGVEAASQRFWGKHAAEITVDEAAVLAGVVRLPLHYCPLIALKNSELRRNVVLRLMYECKVLEQAEYEKYKEVPLVIAQIEKSTSAAHIKEMLRLFLEDLVGKEALYGSGLTIQTTINKTAQASAEKSFSDQCALLKKNISPAIDGALISMDVATGEIKALVGGYHFATSKFNRATQARRQMGSVFKPLVYAAALNAGHSFADTAVDEPISLMQRSGPWEPHNYNHEFNGQMTLATALSCSNNIVAIKTFLSVGADPIIALAQRCHIAGPFYPYPSLALGCVDVTLKEAVGMFNIFANSGVYVEPHLLKWVKDQWGKKIWKASVRQEVVLSSRISSQVGKVLTMGIERAHKKFLDQWIDSEALGKTGTTNDSRSCWFAGSTPELTTVVYVGCDDNRSMGENIYPVRTAFPIWLNYHRMMPTVKKKFSFDPSLQEIFVDSATGLTTYAGAANTISLLL